MTHTKTRPRLAVAALALATSMIAGPLLALPAYAADLDEPVSFDTGHIDAFNIALNDDGSIRLNLKEDVTGPHVQRSPESATLVVKDDAYVTDLPAGYLPPGAPTAMWVLPLTQDPNVLWPGWDSQAAASVYGADANVDIRITGASGPGSIFLWTSGVFGDTVQLLRNGWSLPDTIHQDFLAHTHANWGFTAAGTYTLTAQATITSEDGTKSSTSNVATYAFDVQPVSGDPEPEPISVSIGGASPSYRTGQQATLRATQTPDAPSSRYYWLTRPNTDADWSIVDGAYTDTYEFVVTTEQQVKVVVPDDDENIVAESDPVQILLDDTDEEPILTTVTITGLADTYDVGETMTLTASQNPDTGVNNWQWYIKPVGANGYNLIDGQNTATLTRELTADDNKASVVARLLTDDNELVAESAPTTVTVTLNNEDPETTKPDNAPAPKSADDLGAAGAGGITLGAATVAPGDTLHIGLGTEHASTWVAGWLFSTPALLGGDWTQATASGSITVTIPATAPLGTHRVAVFAADGSLIGWEYLTLAQEGDPSPAEGGLAVTGGTLPFAVPALAIISTMAGAALLLVRRTRRRTSEQ